MSFKPGDRVRTDTGREGVIVDYIRAVGIYVLDTDPKSWWTIEHLIPVNPLVDLVAFKNRAGSKIPD